MPSGRTWQRNAFTLAELIAAMAIFAVLTVAIGGTLMIASRAVDDGTSPGSQTPVARELGDVIIADLGDALDFTERSATAVTFTVPDRDSNGVAETIRYAWDGTAGGVLTREYNGGSAAAIAHDVYAFDLSYLTRTVKPPPQACCYLDGTCLDESPDDCTSNGGLPKGRNTECATSSCIGACCMTGGGCAETTELMCEVAKPDNLYQGDGSTCASATCPGDLAVLFVVTDDTNPSAQELARQVLMESWGFRVELIASSAPQSDFDNAAAEADVAYVSLELDSGELGTKLTNATIGVVNEHPYLIDDFGFSAGTPFSISSSEIAVLDNTHSITSVFALGPLSILSSSQGLIIFGSQPAPGVQFLAEIGNSNGALATVETGAELAGGSPALERRVQLPWGDDTFDFSSLNADGQTLMKRAIEWAAGMETVCGDATCDAGEDPCNCAADCGAPTAFEQPGVDCTDGKDNDCDGQTDCDDINCGAELGCA